MLFDVKDLNNSLSVDIKTKNVVGTRWLAWLIQNSF